MSGVLEETKSNRRLDTESTSLNSQPKKKQRCGETHSQTDGNESDYHSSPLYTSLKPAPFFYYNDHSQEPDSDPYEPIIKIGTIINLPCRIHVILDIQDFADIVSWLPHGRSWQIHNLEEFESRILPQFWKKCTLRSFLRQLNVWGFLPLEMEGGQRCYYHEYFLRGLSHLCKKMIRTDRKSAPKDGMRMVKRGYEPDLYAISDIHPLPERDQSHQLHLLKKSVLSGPDAKMTVDNTTGYSEESLPRNNSASRVRNSVQEATAEAVVSNSDATVGSAVAHGASLTPLQQQLHLQSPSRQQAEHGVAGMMQNMLQSQQQYTRFLTFISPLIRMGVGGANTWNWMTDWWSRYQIAPIFTAEEEQNEMQNLPAQEQLRARADIVGSTLQGDVRTVEEQQIALSLLAEARSQCAGFVDDKWLMLILESENFDVQAAKKRIVEYWRMRVNVLGRRLAFLPLTTKNIFSQEHIQTLKMSLVRFLPVTDLHGRSIIFMEPGKIHGKTYTTSIMVRAFFYVLHAALDQQDIGRNGIVLIVDHSTAQARHADTELGQQLLKIMNNLPFSIKAIHFCSFRNLFNTLAIPLAKFFFSRVLRCRIIQHTEYGEQLLDEFRTFGLPPERLPTELGGRIELDHDRWVEDKLARGI